MGCLWFSAQSSDATTATWINTANGGFWTNSANWSASQYPGQDGVNQNAYLTNRVDGAVYKAVIDTSLPYAVGTVEIKNLGASGEAWVIVTNTAFAMTNLFIRSNGRLQIDNGGAVTNLLGIMMDGTNGQLLVNSGCSLYASNNVYVGYNGNGRSNVLSLGDNTLLTVTNGTLFMGYGAGSSYNRLAVTGNNVRVRTFVAPSIGGSALNEALFTGNGTVWENGNNSRFYFGSGGVSNLMTVSQGSLSITNSTQSLWIGYSTGNGYNRLVVTNSGRLYLQGGLAIGYNGIGSNTVTVTGAGSLLDCLGALVRAGDGGGLNNVMLVDQAGTVSNAYVNVGSAAPAYGNSLILTNGAKWWGGTATSGATIGNACTNNLAVVTGYGTRWDFGIKGLTIGTSAAGVGNVMRIENSAVVTNVGTLYVGNAGGSSNLLTLTKGGQCWVASGQSCYVGNGASSNATSISGSGSVLGCTGNLANGNLFVGGNANATGNVCTVSNGSTSPGWNQIYVGRYSNCVDNALIITNGGSVQASLVRVNHQGSNSWNNTMQVVDSGLVETGSGGLQIDQSAMGPVGNSYITNHGGVYQFTYATPTIAAAPANNSFIYLTDGTISFRAVNTVDVRGNRTGTLTNIVFTGTNNAFRLNNATNATSPDQTYTFANNLGPTNYARLELFNGSFYRGGSVTIGSGGTLAVSGDPSAITNLTIATGGTLEMTVSGTNSASRLNAVGSVALGGTLRLILASPPPPAGFDWTLISKAGGGGMTGAFTGGAIVEQAYQGTNYVFSIDIAGGDGNDLVLHSLGRSIPGTMILVL